MKVKTKSHIGKHLWGIWLFGILSLTLSYRANAQISGMVYRGYNSVNYRAVILAFLYIKGLLLAEHFKLRKVFSEL